MKVTIHPSQLKGIIQAPASKSSMQRALAAALLSKGKTVIQNRGISNDDLAAIEIIEALGALVEHQDFEDVDSSLVKVGENELYVESEGVVPITRDINCRESGLSIRMFTPIIALSDMQITIKGEGSLKQRPMDFFDEILPLLGVKFKSNDGKLPMTVQGPLVPANIEVDGSLSSQFLTGLLMAYSASPNPSEGGASVSNDLDLLSFIENVLKYCWYSFMCAVLIC
jgi:3-phosphoshikimate 1-carboxyvinyltransferase